MFEQFFFLSFFRSFHRFLFVSLLSLSSSSSLPSSVLTQTDIAFTHSIRLIRVHFISLFVLIESKVRAALLCCGVIESFHVCALWIFGSVTSEQRSSFLVQFQLRDTCAIYFSFGFFWFYFSVGVFGRNEDVARIVRISVHIAQINC